MASKRNYNGQQNCSKIGADREVHEEREKLDGKAVKDAELDERNLGCLAIAKLHFNKNRKIIIKNVPPVTYEEVKDFLKNHQISNISISKKSRHAIVTLVDGDKAEDICKKFDGKELLGTEVAVDIYPNENLLCVAHLPFNLEDSEFQDLVSEFGVLERCFLMRSETGRSKGYGFVEWQHNKEKSSQAQQMLDNKKIGSCTLHCEFVSDFILKFDDLQSHCLYIDHLPSDYSNETELTNILSRVTSPIFFKLEVQKESGFAIVEYEDARSAEETQVQVNGYMLDGHAIRVTYCIPGQSATDIYMRLVQQINENSNKHEGLLPIPSLMDITVKPNLMNMQVKPQATYGGAGLLGGYDDSMSSGESIANPLVTSLLAQSPQVLQLFQTVLEQLQQQATTTMNMRPGLLGMAPNMPQQNVLNNPNMQVALLAVLLATQIQQTQPTILNNPLIQQLIRNSMHDCQPMTRPSLLGNPMIAQANMMLHNLNELSSQIPSNYLPELENLNVNMTSNFSTLLTILKSEPSLFNQAPLQFRNTSNATSSGSTSEEINTNTEASQANSGESSTGGVTPLMGVKVPIPQVENAGPANPLLALFMENVIRQQMASMQNQTQATLNQINQQMSSSLKRRHQSVNNNSNPVPWMQNATQSAAGLLPTPSLGGLAGMQDVGGAIRNLFPTSTDVSQPQSLLPTPTDPSVPQPLLPTTTSMLQTQLISETEAQSLLPTLSETEQTLMAAQLAAIQSGQEDLNSPIKKFPKFDDAADSPTASPVKKMPKIMPLLPELRPDTTQDGFQRKRPTNLLKMPTVLPAENTYVAEHSELGDKSDMLPPGYGTNSGHFGQSYFKQLINQAATYYQKEEEKKYVIPPTPLMDIKTTERMSISSESSTNDDTFSSQGTVTPIGPVRPKTHLVPSPEPSPEGYYVGQHSQGLGGHYADSYSKSTKIPYEDY